MVGLYAMVTILACSRVPGVRFATDLTRPTSLERLAWCLDDLSGLSRELLTDREPNFWIGQTSDGVPIPGSRVVDLWRLLGAMPKACRSHRL